MKKQSVIVVKTEGVQLSRDQVNAIGQKIQRATTIEETLKVGIREVGLALGAPEVSASLSWREDSNSLIGSN